MMAVSKRLRYEILRRDNYTCRYCGRAAPEVELRIDHVIAVALGGTDDASNLVTSCEPCNTGKSSTSTDGPLVDDVAQDALRWGRAMERAAQIQAADRARFQGYVDAFDEAWEAWNNDGELMPRPADYTQSLHRLYVGGLESEIIAGAVRTAMEAPGVYNKNLFRYFCGVCYRILEERQEIARSMLSQEED